MANTFRKLQKRIENKDGSYTYEPLSYVGIDNIPLDIMKGASSSSDGEFGLVPKPNKGDENKVLKGDGTWGLVTADGTLNIFSNNNDGLVPKTDKSNWFLTGNASWGYPWIGSKIKDGKTNIIIGSNDEELMSHELSEATVNANGLMSSNDKKFLSEINVEAFHAWSSGAQAVQQGHVPDQEYIQNNAEYRALCAFGNFDIKTINNVAPFERLYKKIDNNTFYNGLKTTKAGVYRFDLRFAISFADVNKRVELAPFVNNTRIAKYAGSYTTAQHYTLIQIISYVLTLKTNDEIKFGFKMVDNFPSTNNNIQISDMTCYLLRPL